MESEKTPVETTVSNEKVEVTDEAKAKAAEMVKSSEDRPTAVVPESHNTVTGTAINEWLDDDGNPKWGQSGSDSAQPKPENN